MFKGSILFNRRPRLQNYPVAACEALEPRLVLTATLATLAAFNGTNGYSPSGVVVDAAGNLYGTTSKIKSTPGLGTVFEISGATHALTTLVTFNGTNGDSPSTLISDAAGNLFGTTLYGGPGNNGTVFEIAAGTHAFTTLGSVNGHPSGPLIFDALGNLDGTTELGIFEISQPTHVLTMFTLPFGNANTFLSGGLVSDAAGNLYGLTSEPGLFGFLDSSGTVVEFSAQTHTLTNLTTPTESSGNPTGNLIFDAVGNLYGTAKLTLNGNYQYYTIFEISAGTRIHSTVAWIREGSVGPIPPTNLIFDQAGNLYVASGGTGASFGPSVTTASAKPADTISYPMNTAAVFEIYAGTRAISTLGEFDAPVSGLILDAAGNLFGTSYSNRGSAFEISAGTHTLTTLASFQESDGINPAGLIADAHGNLYGTTPTAVSLPNYSGTVFEISGAGFITSAPAFVSDTISINSYGLITINGSALSDTIAGGIDPFDSSRFYFLVNGPAHTPEDFLFPTNVVTGVLIHTSPISGAFNPADYDLVNLGGANFNFAVSITGGAGSDTIIGQQSSNTIATGVGSSHNLVYGGLGSDFVYSQGSDDTIRSGGGADTLMALTGNNVLCGGKDGSWMGAGSGHDTLRAGRGNSTLVGGANGSLLLGGFGNDFLIAGSGDDTLIAGSGQSRLDGGDGDDFLDAGWDAYLILQGGATLPTLTAGDRVDGTNSQSDTIVANSGGSTIIVGGLNNDLDINDPSAQFIPRYRDFVARDDTISSITQSTAVHLTIQIVTGGITTNVVIPQGAGGAPAGISTARTTDANGSIVFQSEWPRTFILGDFFNHWGVDFNVFGVGQFIASSGSGHTFGMTVNGVDNNQFNNYIVQNGDNIVVTFTQ